MESKDDEASRRGSADFADSSVLEVVVPSASSADIESALEAWDGTEVSDNPSVFPFLSQRSLLFLGKRNLSSLRSFGSTSYSSLGTQMSW